jgi:hypothetical protein
MAANRRRLVHRLQAEDPLDLSALERRVYPWKDSLGRPEIDLVTGCLGLEGVQDRMNRIGLD